MTCICPPAWIAAYNYHQQECPMHNSKTCSACIDHQRWLDERREEQMGEFYD